MLDATASDAAIEKARQRVWARDMIVSVAINRGVSSADIVGPCRGHDIVPARHEAMWLVRDMNLYSLPEIGLIFGGRHHTTIMYGIERHEERMRDDWAALGRVIDGAY